MRLVPLALLLLALTHVCLADFASLSFSGNITVAQDDANSFTARSVTLISGTIGLFGGFAYRSSTVQGGDGSLSVDTALGGGLLGVDVPPFVYLARRTGEITFTIGDVNGFDASSSTNFMSNLYLRLHERNSANVIVKTQPLSQSILNAAAGVSWALQSSVKTSAEGRLQWCTLRGTPNGASWYVDMTIIASSVIGRLEDAAANAVVSPKSLEIILQINNYPYADAGNHLALVVASCSGSGSASGSSFVTGSGLDRMYLYVSGGARINGSPQGVTVDTWTTIDTNAYDSLIGNGALKTMLQAKFNANFECKATNVSFPAGATTITYDPTLGIGATLGDSPASHITASGLLLLVAIFIAMLNS